MEVNGSQRSRFSNYNKYLKYRDEYEKARGFSKHLDVAQAKSPEKSEKSDKSEKSTKPEKSDKSEKLDKSTVTASSDKPAIEKPMTDQPALETASTPSFSPAPRSKSMATSSPAQNSFNSIPTPSYAPPPPVAQAPAFESAAAPVRVPSTGPAGDRMLDKVREYEPLIRAAASRYDLPAELIAGVIWQESRGNFRAVSHCGAMGLMQLMPATAASLGVGNAFDPVQNIDGGAKYLRQMLDKFGRVDFAVAAYNAGPGNVSKHNGIPPFKETQDYVPKVLGFANSFKVANAFVSSPTNAVQA